MKTYQRFARTLQAFENSIKNENEEWIEKHYSHLQEIMKSAPSGSGIDNGFHWDEDSSNHNKLVFTFEFHHMNENGYYDGWTSHKAIVTPLLSFDYSLKITGSNRNEIKDYLHDTISMWLDEEIE
jgi:hypothetical protein